MPMRWNLPSVRLSRAISRSPCRTWISTEVWLSAAVENVSVLLVGIVRDEQVVLAEHPLGHEPEEHAHLGACHAPSDGSDGTAGHPVGDARGEGMEHATHRRDVGVYPLRSIEHAGRSCTGRVQTGEVSDQLLGTGGDRREVRVQRFTEV